MSSSPWDRLAAAVVARRNARGWTQVEVAYRGGLSLDRMQAIEGARATSYRPKTMQALERGLEWMPGSASRVLAGDEPEGAELTAEREHMELSPTGTAEWLKNRVNELTAELAAKNAVIDAAKTWRRAVAETGDYEISDSDVLIAAIDALPTEEVAR